MQNISFFEAGKGFPVIFLHGFCESNKIWKDLSRELSSDFRVICPDLPGFGQSPLPEPGFSLEDIADLLVRWLKANEVDSCIVIGHSLGGYITLEILRKHSSFVKGIGLFNSAAFEDAPDKKESRNKLIEFISDHGVNPFIKTFVPSLFYPPTESKHQHIIDQISKDADMIVPEAVTGYASAMRDRMDSIHLLKENSERVLLIGGEYDQNVPLEKTRNMAKLIDKKHVHIIPDSAHMSLFEQPQLCYSAIRGFVNDLL